ncbi:Dolichyldiphosphatase 1, variant 3 [Schistosoma haematobium]|uniref:Dolichyldiphosphatase n=1 Tax=Schistosoma haematobium TaxID=6185 RepID=A0A922S6N4_SCHHA|nr:Dolichyldiphosphatase 1, variant 3 [Schistosoma haematobium]KAH9596131.1 Dolichyldiphosphatase 1, variant 3 [Schistosoma haematobium]
MVPIFIIFSIITLIMSRRDLHTIFYFCGCLINELSNYFLKYIIKQPRPFPTIHLGIKSSGMPSNHAQFMGFFCVYIGFFLFIRLVKPLLIRLFRLNQRSFSRQFTTFVYLVCASVTAVVCYSRYLEFLIISRVYLLYHTSTQVLVGIIIGGIFGMIWFLIVQYAITPIFPRFTDSWIGQLLMLQDFTHINNLMHFEYTIVQNYIQPSKLQLKRKDIIVTKDTCTSTWIH